ncbi:hypothetical protein [Paraburkholderia sp. BL17N1]|uniref:hypothetical protein n=1 Tax=Paraburkholderia sp. BL17N1 TaxID=1938798 RepID=UPI001315358B|nr:hypothetical protein [Paraburkholderia sp. BL17N1]
MRTGPNIAFVVAFIECSNQTVRDHENERMQIIQATLGFAERIVADFDYSVFRKAA